MTPVELLIVCLAAVAITYLVTRRPPESPAPARLAAGACVVVHTFDHRSLRGVATHDVADPRDDVVIGEAALLIEGQPQPLGGTQRVPASNVAWVQEL